MPLALYVYEVVYVPLGVVLVSPVTLPASSYSNVLVYPLHERLAMRFSVLPEVPYVVVSSIDWPHVRRVCLPTASYSYAVVIPFPSVCDMSFPSAEYT